MKINIFIILVLSILFGCEGLEDKISCETDSDCPLKYSCNRTVDRCEILSCSGCPDDKECTLEDHAVLCDCGEGFVFENNECVELDLCDLVTCEQHAHCEIIENVGSCVCDEGYIDDDQDGFCTLIENNSCEDVTCSGHGSCDIDQNGDPFCVCDYGYKQKEFNVLECEPSCIGVTCSDHGTCQINGDKAICICEANYIVTEDGFNCKNPCDGISCSDHGECVVTVDGAACNCETGYIPKEDNILECILETEACDQLNCETNDPNSHCIVNSETNQAECVCKSGYDYQEDGECVLPINRDECESICSGGTCTSLGDESGKQYCLCDYDDDNYFYNDNNCVILDNNQCFNNCGNGQCEEIVDGSGDYICNCGDGYIISQNGLNCIPIDDLCTGVTCSNHGTCVSGAGETHCVCDEGYYDDGLTCIENPCVVVTCSDHGVCNIDEEGYPYCVCDENYVVDELNCILDLCAGYVCGDNEVCTISDGTPSCSCVDGYYLNGNVCVSPLTNSECEANCEDGGGGAANGSCQSVGGNNYICICDTNYQDNDGDGFCEPSCEMGLLECQNEGICDDSYGSVQCECLTGYDGDFCEVCSENSIYNDSSCQSSNRLCGNIQCMSDTTCLFGECICEQYGTGVNFRDIDTIPSGSKGVDFISVFDEQESVELFLGFYLYENNLHISTGESIINFDFQEHSTSDERDSFKNLSVAFYNNQYKVIWHGESGVHLIVLGDTFTTDNGHNIAQIYTADGMDLQRITNSGIIEAGENGGFLYWSNKTDLFIQKYLNSAAFRYSSTIKSEADYTIKLDGAIIGDDQLRFVWLENNNIKAADFKYISNTDSYERTDLDILSDINDVDDVRIVSDGFQTYIVYLKDNKLYFYNGAEEPSILMGTGDKNFDKILDFKFYYPLCFVSLLTDDDDLEVIGFDKTNNNPLYLDELILGIVIPDLSTTYNTTNILKYGDSILYGYEAGASGIKSITINKIDCVESD